MKKEYDFSKAERGKFFKSKVKINLPIYLDQENLRFIEQIAKKKHLDISIVVNSLIKGDKQIADIID